MKIAFVQGIYFPSPGGAQIQGHNLANMLQENDVEVDVYLFRKTNVRNNFYDIKYFNYYVTSFLYLFFLIFNHELVFLTKLYLKTILKEKKYDLWHFNFLNFKSLLIINALKELGEKVIVTFQGADIQVNKEIFYGYRFNKNYSNLLLKSLKNIDQFIAISQNIKKDLLNLDIPMKKILILSNSVNLRKFEKILSRAKESKKIKLITVARFAEKKKGFDLINNIIESLNQKKILYEWTIIGKNSRELSKYDLVKNNSEKFKLIEDIQKQDDNYFPSNKLIEYYKASDVYINLARIESFGITLIESLAARTPVVTFDTKGANEIIKEGYNGNIIKKNDFDSFAEKIKLYKENQEELERIKKNCIKSVEVFDLTNNTHSLIKIYKRLI